MNRPRTVTGLAMLTVSLALVVPIRLGASTLVAADSAVAGATVGGAAATTQPTGADEPPQLIRARIRERTLWRNLNSTSVLARSRVDSKAAPLLVPPPGKQRQQWLRQWNEWIDCRAYWRQRWSTTSLRELLGETPGDKPSRKAKYVTLFVAVQNRSRHYVLTFRGDEWTGLAEGVLCGGLATIHPNDTSVASVRVRLDQRPVLIGADDKLVRSSRVHPTRLMVPLKVRWDERDRVSAKRAKKLRKLELELALLIEVSEAPDRPLSRVTSRVVLDTAADQRHRRRVRQFLKR